MRKVYLSNTPRRQALDAFLDSIEVNARPEMIPVSCALGRVTARPVFAPLSMPGYRAAAMDGIAVRAETTFTASDQNPLTLDRKCGFKPVNTGAALPPGFDAVIKIEDVYFPADGEAEILAPATPWQHVRAVGEDVVAGEMIVSSGHLLRPADLGAILAGGADEVEVFARPVGAIIPTGSEVIDPSDKRRPGSIPDFNSTVIAAYLKQWGAEALICPIVPDDRSKIGASLLKALEKADFIIIIAGSSAGDKDYTFAVIEELGKVYQHGVATRPGKPTILGQVGGKPVIGLPGYPVSAYLSLEWFALPLVCRFLKQPLPEREKLMANLGRRVVSEMGTEEFVRMSIGHVSERFIANPLTRGAGVTMSLVRADGLLVIPANSLGYEQNELVEIELYRPKSELFHNLLAAGSHDLIIDFVANALKEKDPRASFSSAHLGSMGGINAISRGQAHLAGIHLYDPVTAEYNVPFVRRFFSDGEVRLVNLAYRMQGWIVPAGNPDNLETVNQLAEKQLPFVNRQKGAGTRLLFDHLLDKAAIDPGQISGYEREEHTHLNVAAAVAAGTARAGLGILSAAKAFGLGFAPIMEERYDLLMSPSFFESAAGEMIMKVIADSRFQESIEALGGYSMRDAGSIIV